MLGFLLSSVVYIFLLKIQSLVLIKNYNSCVYLICILSSKLDLKQETRFTIICLTVKNTPSYYGQDLWPLLTSQ
jgi:hypothetical protein